MTTVSRGGSRDEGELGQARASDTPALRFPLCSQQSTRGQFCTTNDKL